MKDTQFMLILATVMLSPRVSDATALALTTIYFVWFLVEWWRE